MSDTFPIQVLLGGFIAILVIRICH